MVRLRATGGHHVGDPFRIRRDTPGVAGERGRRSFLCQVTHGDGSLRPPVQRREHQARIADLCRVRARSRVQVLRGGRVLPAAAGRGRVPGCSRPGRRGDVPGDRHPARDGDLFSPGSPVRESIRRSRVARAGVAISRCCPRHIPTPLFVGRLPPSPYVRRIVGIELGGGPVVRVGVACRGGRFRRPPANGGCVLPRGAPRICAHHVGFFRGVPTRQARFRTPLRDGTTMRRIEAIPKGAGEPNGGACARTGRDGAGRHRVTRGRPCCGWCPEGIVGWARARAASFTPGPGFRRGPCARGLRPWRGRCGRRRG